MDKEVYDFPITLPYIINSDSWCLVEFEDVDKSPVLHKLECCLVLNLGK